MNDNTSPQKLGRGMLIAAWIICLAMLTLIFGQWENYRRNPNSDPDSRVINGVREVTLKENQRNHYLADGMIHGQSVTFLLDTGATDVVIPEKLAAKLGLVPGAAQLAMTANGIVEVRTTRIERLSLGNIQLYDVRASINPGMEGDQVLLGMSALKQVDFSQKDGKMVLRQN
jgi:aspartyl protease family protein